MIYYSNIALKTYNSQDKKLCHSSLKWQLVLSFNIMIDDLTHLTNES